MAFFQSTGTDQKSSFKLNDTSKCQIGPFDLRRLTESVFLFSAQHAIPGDA